MSEEEFKVCERCHDNYVEIGSTLCAYCKETLSILKANEEKEKKVKIKRENEK